MKIILSQQIRLQDFRKGYQNIYKEFESTVIPHKGDLISDSCFKDPYEYEVVEVTINYQQNECFVGLKAIELETNDTTFLNDYVEMSKLHGWTTN